MDDGAGSDGVDIIIYLICGYKMNTNIIFSILHCCTKLKVPTKRLLKPLLDSFVAIIRSR